MKGSVFLTNFQKDPAVTDTGAYFPPIPYDIFILQQLFDFAFVIRNHFVDVKTIVRFGKVLSFIQNAFPGKPRLKGFQEQHFI